jgi:hypothetical protein
VHLSTAGLRLDEFDLVTQALEDRHHRPAGLRVQNVVRAGDEQRYAHRALLDEVAELLRL